MTLINSTLDPLWPGKALSQPEARRIQRLLLYPGELGNVPAAFRWMRVASGKAYFTHLGQDRIIGAGETVALDPAQDMALVSALNGAALVIELFTHEPAAASRSSLAPAR